MTETRNTIPLGYTDSQVNEKLKKLPSSGAPYTQHFNQNEEFFIKLSREVEIPSFPIHHDVRSAKPTQEYMTAFRELIDTVSNAAPGVFSGLTWFFNPGESLSPSFFQIFKIRDTHYLYLLTMDLTFRTHEAEMMEKSGNDDTARYKTRKLFLDGLFIPLSGIEISEGRTKAFNIKQTISQTWIGETGRGYFVQGIWMDHELTKFFTKSLLAEEQVIYPYYPFVCKYRSLCHKLLELDWDGRKRHAPLLHRAMLFFEPRMRTIENALRNKEFTEDLPEFQNIKQNIPSYWKGAWDRVSIKSYLNESEMKEYAVAFKSQ